MVEVNSWKCMMFGKLMIDNSNSGICGVVLTVAGKWEIIVTRTRTNVRLHLLRRGWRPFSFWIYDSRIWIVWMNRIAGEGKENKKFVEYNTPRKYVTESWYLPLSCDLIMRDEWLQICVQRLRVSYQQNLKQIYLLYHFFDVCLWKTIKFKSKSISRYAALRGRFFSTN